MRQDIEQLISRNTGLVYSQLHKFHLIDDQDAESFAYEALGNAAKDFDETKGNKFSTVATVYIYNALCGYLRRVNAKRQLEVVSYNALIRTEGGDEHEYLETLASDTNIEDNLIKQEKMQYAVKVFNEAFGKLQNVKHVQIVELWKKSEYMCTATDIAKKTGLSQSYVSQTLKNFQHTLRTLMEEKYVKGN